MESLFSTLSEALSGAPWLALLAAGAWGLASLVLSPCHLASIPLIVAFVSRRGDGQTGRTLSYAGLFSAGILLSIVLVGGLTAAAGRLLGDLGSGVNYAVAFVMAWVGLHLAGLVPLPWKNGLSLPQAQGMVAAFVIGLIFGIALGPCTFAFLAPVLSVVFTVARAKPVFAALLVLSYAIGHCLLILLAGISTHRVQSILDWHEASKGALWLRRVSGTLVFLGAAWLAFSGG